MSITGSDDAMWIDGTRMYDSEYSHFIVLLIGLLLFMDLVIQIVPFIIHVHRVPFVIWGPFILWRCLLLAGGGLLQMEMDSCTEDRGGIRDVRSMGSRVAGLRVGSVARCAIRATCMALDVCCRLLLVLSLCVCQPGLDFFVMASLFLDILLTKWIEAKPLWEVSAKEGVTMGQVSSCRCQATGHWREYLRSTSSFGA